MVELGLEVLSLQATAEVGRGESGTLWMEVGGGVGMASEIMTNQKIFL